MPSSVRRQTPGAFGRARRDRGVCGRAAVADKYDLYHLAVQAPDDEVVFLERVYRERRKRVPRHLREDFSGTALVATEWVKRSHARTAEAYDIDAEVFDWARENHVGELGRVGDRLQLCLSDVRAPSLTPPDVRCAENFSYFIFSTRPEMLDYFRAVHRDLAPDGIFVIDAWGGAGATDPIEEKRSLPGGVTYVWEQESYEPATGAMTCHIHFRFRDGSALEKAFSYSWRYWFLPELRDILFEAGFAGVDSYFEDLGADGEGTGVFSRGPGPVDASYIAYLVAAK